MRRKSLFILFLISLSFVSLIFYSCPTRPEGIKDIIKTEVPMSHYFSVTTWTNDNWVLGSINRSNVAGWLVKNETTGIWSLAPPASGGNPGHNSWSTDAEFYGVRLFGVDKNLSLKSNMDVSMYDGMTFKYRTNIMDVQSRMRDCMFWWEYSSRDYFGAWNYENGFANPDPDLGWREVIIPFYRMWKWGIPQNVTTPCNDTTKFQPQIFTAFRFDGRSPADGKNDRVDYWLEIVDLAFFNYQ